MAHLNKDRILNIPAYQTTAKQYAKQFLQKYSHEHPDTRIDEKDYADLEATILIPLLVLTEKQNFAELVTAVDEQYLTDILKWYQA